MALKKQHHLPNLLLLGPGLPDHGDPFFSYTLDLSELIQFVFDDIESLLAEPLDDSLGHDRTNALDQTGAQVFSDAIDRCGDLRLEMRNLELLAVSRVMGPFAFHDEDFSRSESHKIPHHGGQPPLSRDLDLGNGEPILFVGVGDSFDLALQFCEHVSVTEICLLNEVSYTTIKSEVDARITTS